MTTSLTMTIPRGWAMTANQRLHWAVRHERTALLKGDALTIAHAARLPRGLDRVRITAHISYPGRRARDVHNLMPTIKPIIDGLVAYGLIPDDTDAHLIGPDLRADGVTLGVYTVRLEIEELTP